MKDVSPESTKPRCLTSCRIVLNQDNWERKMSWSSVGRKFSSFCGSMWGSCTKQGLHGQ